MHKIWPALEDEVSCFNEVSPVMSCHPRGGCHFGSSSQCQLCAPASSRVCLYPWGANPRCSPIRNPWLSNSSLPTQLPKPAQEAGAAPLGHQTTARTVESLSSISNHPPTCFQLWQHWRIQAKEKKSWPLKVERCFRHWCGQLQQGPSESQQGLEGTAGASKENVQTTPCKGERPMLAAASRLVPTTSTCQKRRSPQKVRLALCWLAY